jgi:hypothetical protein
MTIRVLNPTSESVVATLNPAPRLVSLEGKTVGLISNGKEGTAGFLPMSIGFFGNVTK